MKEEVGDFYVHLVEGSKINKDLTSSNQLLRLGNANKPSVIHFYSSTWESASTALLFEEMFGFTHSKNAYIPSRSYMPVGYGQLGCSGFIIVDKEGFFVTKKSAAFLDYGEQAFRQVESILHSLIDTAPRAQALPTSTKQEESKDDFTVPTLGIQSMDDEHDRCDKLLKELLELPSQATLKLLLKELQNHFAHEEALMVQYGFGGDPSDPFSAIVSHCKDHKRILTMVEQGMEQAQEIANAVAADCNGGAWHKNVVDTKVIETTVATAIVKAFSDHATRFDALYANHIPAAAH